MPEGKWGEFLQCRASKGGWHLRRDSGAWAHIMCCFGTPPWQLRHPQKGWKMWQETFGRPHPRGDHGPRGWVNRADRKSVSQQLFLMLRQSRGWWKPPLWLILFRDFEEMRVRALQGPWEGCPLFWATGGPRGPGHAGYKMLRSAFNLLTGFV